ncbi:GHMP kinase [Desulfitobacterium sp. Sab5]|uniref:GHMP family kinase ATP-binding protein n=1 Tax=Desulfitobacterium nosdiversum TaxID=3375356 RepID=UPI003CFBA1AB
MSEYYGWAQCPGTCGEWIQGGKEGIPFLIDCPVNRYVELETYCVTLPGKENSEWRISPQKTKTEKALMLLAKRIGINFKGTVKFHSELPVGKGMASSSADLSAVMASVLTSIDISWSPEDLAKIALTIEPSDPVMFPGIIEFAHQDGKYMQELGPNAEAHLLVLDWGGIVDTQRFNTLSGLKFHYRKNELKIQKALQIFYEGISESDLEKLAYASTISAQCNQEINPKPFTQEFIRFVQRMGGLGILTAHSGTITAGIFPPEISAGQKEEILESLHIQFKPARSEWMETQNGGIKSLSLKDRLIKDKI